MVYTYKILSILLDYPNSKSKDVLNESMAHIDREGILSKQSKKRIEKFVDSFKNVDLLEWQTIYSSLFDCSPVSSLYLFDHVYGDSKMRGMAMVDLKQLYFSEGMEINSNELPDYLPLYLEFLSNLKDIKQIFNLTSEIEHVLDKIYKSLSNSNSEYQYLIEALLSLCKKGSAEKLTLEEKEKIESFRACESCFFTSEECFENKQKETI
jgi:nitrate reductase molybdenum cofactor assembly chaperone